MPSRNVIKEYAPDSYYHVYNRGVAKQRIFLDKADYVVFLGLLKRYLGEETQNSRHRHSYPNYRGQIELMAFCLMPTHFHLFLYQHAEPTALTKLLQSICTSYTLYFNKKYKRVGKLYQGVFKASRISRDEYLHHISRYIHLNPRDYQNYEWSSLPYYFGMKQADWINPSKVMDLFDEVEDYRKFLADYEDYKASLDEIKSELAA